MNTKFNQARAALIALPLTIAGAAHAALPTEVNTAIDAAGDDLVAAVGLVIVAMVAFWGLKKLGTKMGWF